MDYFKTMFKDLWSSKLSLLGVAMVTVSAVLIITASLLNILGLGGGSYSGLVAYGILPVVFVAGLMMIPAGVWKVRKRARLEGRELQPLVVNLGDPVHRYRIIFYLVMTFINSIILSVALYEGYHYTDSNEFCGLVCHTVMEPEYTAYQRSPHARVLCAECHIGSGASWYVKSKLSGLRQVWAVLTHSYQTPIPTPVENLRPARETCEQCHLPRYFHGRKAWVRQQPGPTPADPLATVLLLNIGGQDPRTGKFVGIHWHVSPDSRVEYLATDGKRSKIKRVRAVRPDGQVLEFVKKDLPDPPAGAEWRVLDCIDCHNRPTHVFDDPQKAVDRAILNAQIDPSLPDIRTAAVTALTKDYGVTSQPERMILQSLEAFYSEKYPAVAKDQANSLRQAAAALAGIYRVNVFPKMKVTFGTHPVQLGHPNDTGGCFRCHDEEHAAADGKTISQDCGLCHELLAQEEPKSTLKAEIRQLIE